MMKCFRFAFLVCSALPMVLGSWSSAELKDGDSLKMARGITGHFFRGSCMEKQTLPEWDPMNEDDRQYVGPVESKPAKFFIEIDCDALKVPETIGSEDDLKHLIYVESMRLTPSHVLKLSCGVTPKVIRKWLNRINTSLYGEYVLEEDEDSGDLILKATYNTEARILAAFRYAQTEGALDDKEKKVLNTCAEWIADNITVGMPNGLKLKKVHDALVDNSKYTKGCHSTAEIVLEGKGVCSAYTSATQLLLHMLKIDCRRVYGTEKMNHVWNLVELNDEWYHLDVTWDDPSGGSDMRMYNYYLLTDVEMDADHDWVNPDYYPATPEVNPWHFPVRNDMRRSWVAGSQGYSLPREEESVTQSMYNMYLKEAAGRGEQFAGMLGIDVQRKARAEEALRMGEGGDPAGVAKHWLKYKPKFARMKKGSGGKDAVEDYRDFNEVLEAYANELAGPRLLIKCKDKMDGWKLREIVGKSDINVYARKYNAIYDERKSTITLDIEYWPHVRVLTAALNEDAVKKLTSAEKKALAQCKQWIDSQQSLIKRKRAQVKKIHQEMLLHAELTDEPSALCEMTNSHKSLSLGYAEAMYVVLNMMDIPCIMVHGRLKTSCGCADQAWNLVRVNKREWYHANSAADDLENHKGEHEFKYCLRRDDEMKENHAWDREEIPPTPTREEKEGGRKLSPFNFGR